MNHSTPVIIFSVYRADRSSRYNRTEHDIAVRHLEFYNVAFATGCGRYHGQAERCIVVVLHNDVAERTARFLANLYKQESVLYVDANQQARLETPDGELIESLGSFIQVSQITAVAKGSYTAVNGRHWITRGESDADKRSRYERALIAFARDTLDILESYEDWNADTLDDIGACADAGGLARVVGDRALFQEIKERDFK